MSLNVVCLQYRHINMYILTHNRKAINQTVQWWSYQLDRIVLGFFFPFYSPVFCYVSPLNLHHLPSKMGSNKCI